VFDLRPFFAEIPVALPTHWDASWTDQVIVLIAAFGFKPLHMLLELVLIVILWRQRARDLTLLRRGLIWMFFGESACAVGYCIACDSGHAMELLHVVGMVGMGALFPYGLFAMLDDRVLHLTDPGAGCAASRFCQPCSKHGPSVCPAQRAFLFSAVFLGILCLIPLLSPLQPLKNDFVVFGTPVHHGAGARRLIWDLRVIPFLGVLGALACCVSLLLPRPALLAAQRTFFFATGCASYALLRFFLLGAFRERLGWADVWEEMTELFLVLAVALVLWLWRAPLGIRPARGISP